MDILIKEVMTLRKKCKDVGFATQKRLGTDDRDPRHGCFAQIFNTSTLTVELLSYYFNCWKRQANGSKEEIEEKRKENAERVILITKMHFINCMSAIEFCMKEKLRLFQDNGLSKWYTEKLDDSKPVYMRSIVKESEKNGIITTKELEFWECLIDVRNFMVHNNAIADKTEICDLDGIQVEFVQGQMIRGKLGFLTKLADKSVDLYKLWVEKQI